ncbi:MAG: ATP-binding protein [Thermodesulfobacteriota bacterium]
MSSATKNKGLRGKYLLVTSIFVALAIALNGLMLFHWFKVLEPRLRAEAEVQSSFLAHSQTSGLVEILSSDVGTLGPDEVTAVIDRILLFSDPETGEEFFASIALVIDYDVILAKEGSLDLRRGADCSDCFTAEVPLYSNLTDELMGIATFEVSAKFFKLLSLDVRNKLVIESGAALVLLFVVWLAVLNLVRKLQRQIEERRKAEQALIESEKRLKQLADASFEGIVIHEDGSVIDCNDAAAVIFGTEPGALLKRNLDDLFSDEESVTERLAVAEDSPFEVAVEKEDGVVIYMELRGRDIEYKGRATKVLVFRDISDRKLAELRIKEYAVKLESSNRELSEFAFTASHDLREPLRKINAYSELLTEECGDVLNEDGKGYITSIQNAIVRMQNLMTALLSYSRITTSEDPFIRTELSEVTKEAVDDLQVLLRESGGTVEIAEDMPIVEGDQVQLRQLLFNLIGNALKYRKKDIPPVVKVTAAVISGDRPGAEGPYCIINVADNGIGFDEKYAEKIFTVFQRLHGRDEYEGTGIGLALCNKIVTRHGGAISAESRPGEGSVFKVALPTHQRKEV